MFVPSATLISRSRSFSVVTVLACCAASLAQSPQAVCSGYSQDYSLPDCTRVKAHTSYFGIEVRGAPGFIGNWVETKIENCCKTARTIPGPTIGICTTLPGGGETLSISVQGSAQRGYSISLGGSVGSISETDQKSHQVSGGLTKSFINDTSRDVKLPDIPACWIKGKKWQSVNCKVDNIAKFAHCYQFWHITHGEYEWAGATATGTFSVTTHRCIVQDISVKCTNKECK